LDAEQSYRTMLLLSLETGRDRGELALRKGRRYLWIRDALEPLRDRLPRAPSLPGRGDGLRIAYEALDPGPRSSRRPEAERRDHAPTDRGPRR
ncbi:MAG TPA: hypothetical protein VMT85_22175, partial [Thermoanaerobaculia bacterium]|nr:hypothetical protein [Thermoanaerobaculia bacterium]